MCIRDSSDTLRKNQEALQQQLKEDIQRSHEELKEELRGQLKEDHEKNKEELKHQLEQQLEGYCKDIKRKVSETNEKIKTTSETVAKAQEEILSKIKAVEDVGKNRIEEL